MAFSIDEFREYLKIDKHTLDDELIEQPMLFFQVSEAVAQADARRDKLKEELATVDAELDTDGRIVIEKAGDKITEGAVKAHIQTSKKHSQAFKAYMDAKSRADVLSNLKNAFHQRNYMLRELCSLYTANYFEGASVKPNHVGREIVADRRREALNKDREERRQAR